MHELGARDEFWEYQGKKVHRYEKLIEWGASLNHQTHYGKTIWEEIIKSTSLDLEGLEFCCQQKVPLELIIGQDTDTHESITFLENHIKWGKIDELKVMLNFGAIPSETLWQRMQYDSFYNPYLLITEKQKVGEIKEVVRAAMEKYQLQIATSVTATTSGLKQSPDLQKKHDESDAALQNPAAQAIEKKGSLRI